jgi:hypothetical protein
MSEPKTCRNCEHCKRRVPSWDCAATHACHAHIADSGENCEIPIPRWQLDSTDAKCKHWKAKTETVRDSQLLSEKNDIIQIACKPLRSIVTHQCDISPENILR